MFGAVMSDPFEAKFPVYTFERKCKESEEVELGDATHHVIFNASAYEKEENPEIKAFLAFVKNNKAESDLTREIATMVQTKKFEQSFINEYLAWTLHDQDVEMRGRKEGHEAGRKEQALETVRRMMASGKYDLNEISDISGLTVQDIKALSANP